MDANPTPPVVITPEAPQSTRVPLSERFALSPAEAGRLLGLGRSATYAAIRSGEIPHVRIGGRILIPVAPLLAMLNGEPLAGKAEAVKLRVVG